MPPSVDVIHEKYIETRDLIAEKKKALEVELEELKALQDKRLAWLHQEMRRMGVDSFKTSHGTSFITTKDSVSVADKLAFKDWVVANNEWDILDLRASKTAVKQRVEEGHPPPPGVNYTTFQEVQVRRK